MQCFIYSKYYHIKKEIMSKLLGKEKNTVFLLFCKAWVALLEGSRFIDYQIADQVFAYYRLPIQELLGQFDVLIAKIPI